MPHLDEGTIHAWLDGALSAAEASEAEAHVRECRVCQADVAEARGLIAGSSRILQALDEVPAGVVPERPPEVTRQRAGSRWVRPMAMAFAATLVLAVGTITYKRYNSPMPIADGGMAAVGSRRSDSVIAAPESVQEKKQTMVPPRRVAIASGAVGGVAAEAQPPALATPPVKVPAVRPHTADVMAQGVMRVDSGAAGADSMHLPRNERRVALGAAGRGGGVALSEVVTTATGEQRKVEVAAPIAAGVRVCYAGLPSGVITLDSARVMGDSVTITLPAPDGRVLRGVREGVRLRLHAVRGDTTTVILTVVGCR